MTGVFERSTPVPAAHRNPSFAHPLLQFFRIETQHTSDAEKREPSFLGESINRDRMHRQPVGHFRDGEYFIRSHVCICSWRASCDINQSFGR